MVRKALFPALLAALAALVVAPSALGVVTSGVDAAGKLTVTTDAADPITVTCAAGNVQVNAADPPTGVATCASITAIEVSGGTTGHPINLGGVTVAEFPALTSTLLVGTSSSDNITGSELGDVINAGAGGDTITGGPGGDLITPGLGSDNLIFGPSASPEADTLVLPYADRGDQLNFASLAAGDPVTVDLTGAAPTIAIHTNRTVVIQAGGTAEAITTALGGNGGDVMRAHPRGTVLSGGPGNDTLIGGPGNDVFRGGAGNDSMTGGPGDDDYSFDLAAAAETDTAVELPGEGQDGLSFFFPAGTPDIFVDLSTPELTIASHTNRTLLVGSAGQAANFEGVTTGGGNDVLIGNGSANSLSSSTGNDRIEGRGGDDTLAPGEGNDTALGGSGDDTYQIFLDLNDPAETKVLSESPGEGRDRLELLEAVDWTVNLASEDTTLATSSAGSIVTSQPGQARSFEEIVTSSGDDAITGNGADNLIDAGAGANTSSGGRGDDTYIFQFSPSPAQDVITELPGEGDDTLEFVGLTGGRLVYGFGIGVTQTPSVLLNLASATTSLGTYGKRALLVAKAGQGANLENAHGSDGDDQLTGNDAPNRLKGGKGDDVLRGGRSDDILVGGAGSDTTHGQAGDDTYKFSAATRGLTEIDTIREPRRGGEDTLDFSDLGTARGVTVNLGRASKAIGGTVARRLRVEVGVMARYLEHIIGGRGPDRLTGNRSDNTLIGGHGNDRLFGRRGHDTLLGGAGADRLFGNAGDDHLVGGTGNDVLRAHGGSDRLSGGAGSDALFGNGGNDRADGGAGADRLNGGPGNDALSGGPGRDTFIARDGNSDGLVGGPGRDGGPVDLGLDRLRSIERPR